MMRAFAIGLFLWITIGATSYAQSLTRAGVVAPAPRDTSGETPIVPGWLGQQSERTRALAPLASLLLPGAGQAMRRENRFLAYLAVEAWAWWKYAKDVRERSAQEALYKDLAFGVARANYASAVKGPLPDSGWLYYEWMRDRLESGVYSKVPGGPVVPETDTSTYNGQRWLLAQGTNPTYAGALAQYEREAIRPEYQWSWKNNQFAYDAYVRTTDKRNDAAHAAVQDLLVIGANHVLSAVDAFAMIRLQVRPNSRGGSDLGVSVRW